MNSHMEKYKILNIYKEDKYQKIALASEKGNPEKIVILNIIQKKFLPDANSIDKFRNCIDSLIFSEESKDEIILTTTYKKGFPISKYIQYYNPILKTRINFVYEYLDKLTDYDCLDIKPANSLVSESQVIIEQNSVKFNDLLVIDDSFEKAGSFKDICKTVHKTLTLLIFGKLNIPAAKLKELPIELRSFLSDLAENKKNYISFKGILMDFKTVYLYNLYLDDTNSALLMKDVKDSIKSSEERPMPIYNPINAFGFAENPPSDSGKGTAPDMDSMESDEPVSKTPDESINPTNEVPEAPDAEDEGVLLDDYMSASIANDASSTVDLASSIDDPGNNLGNDQTNDIENDLVANVANDSDDYQHGDSNEPADNSANESSLEDNEYEDNDAGLAAAGFYNYENDYTDLFNSEETPNKIPEDLKQNKNGRRDKKVLAIILIAALLGIILTICSKTDLLFFKDNLPVATFQHERLYDEWIFQVDDSESVFQSYEWTVKQNGKDALSGSGSELRFKETFLDEGEFTVSLRILDDENNWSQTYSNNYYNIINDINTINIDPNSDQSKEQFDSLSVQFQDESSISKDDTVFRNGTYSLQISGNKQNGESKLTINKLVMDNNSVISMWILSDSTEPFKVQLLGYNGKSLAFKRSVNFKPSSKNYWELLSVSQETNNVDRLEIVFSNMSSRIWIDDLDINSYK
ncbi:MAG: hypothetical protein JJE29_08285 [Peptostreptococcaceae bacterium]|nr:hypothetical protein [Peptostreptococcaceae bacterium]